MSRKCVGSCRETCAVYAILDHNPAVDQIRVSTRDALMAEELEAQGVTPNTLAGYCDDGAPHKMAFNFGKLLCSSQVVEDYPRYIDVAADRAAFGLTFGSQL
jgi:hypothetical protein